MNRPAKSAIATILALAFFTAAPGSSQTAGALPAFWGDLVSGPYAVGFETVEVYDKSRVGREKYDYDGVPYEGERSRPIQICIWYPAESSPEVTPLVYSEYVFALPTDDNFFDYLSQLQGRELFFLRGVFGNNVGRVRDILDEPVAAVRGASRASGSFPLILYHGNNVGGFSENAVLLEYLASHGFIVATSHAVGAAQLTPTYELDDIETVIRDRELVFGYMRDYPNLDTEKTALVSAAYGGLTAVLMQMRNYDIDAVVAIDPVFAYGDGWNVLTDNPCYDISRAQVPIMFLYPETRDTTFDLSAVDVLRYCDRYLVGVPHATGADMNLYGLMPLIIPDSTTDTARLKDHPYFSVCRGTRDFLEANLVGPGRVISAVTPPLALPGNKLLRGEKPPPTEAQFGRMVQQGRIAAAVEIFEKLREADSTRMYFQEVTINTLGYQLLGQNRVVEAQQILRLNTIAYPGSANSWDSYADACLAMGDTETAVSCYERVLEVLPTDSLINNQFREILLNNANQGLEQYRR